MSSRRSQGSSRSVSPENDSPALDIQTRQVPTGLENENETQDAQHTPEAPRITFPLCVKCNQQPRQFHVLYCCESVYCRDCLFTKLKENSQEEQTICDRCQEPINVANLTWNNQELEATEGPSVVPESPSSPCPKSAKLGSNDLPANFNQNLPNFVNSASFSLCPNIKQNITEQQDSIKSNCFPTSLGSNCQTNIPSTSFLPSIYPQSYLATNLFQTIKTDARNIQAHCSRESFIPLGDTNKTLLKQSHSCTTKEKEIPMKKVTYEKKEDTILEPTCGVCWECAKRPVSTYCCEKIYCQICLTESLKMRPRCPTCNRNLPSSEFPDSYKVIENLPPVERPTSLKETKLIMNPKSTSEGVLDSSESILPTLIKEATETKEQRNIGRKNNSRNILSAILGDLAEKLKSNKQIQQRELEAVIQDKKFLDENCSGDCPIYTRVLSTTSSLSGSDCGSSNSNDSLPSILSDPISPVIQAGDERLRNHLNAFCSHYHDSYSRYSNDDSNLMSQTRINAMIEWVDGVTKYEKVTRIGNLNHYCEQNPEMNHISSLEFDINEELFVVTGATKKMKIFNFENFITNPEKPQLPLTQLICQNKISSVSWNPFRQEILACGDSSGDVSIWNVNTGKVAKLFGEHVSKCCSVHFNNLEPNIMASGSTDGKVKLWNTNCDRSVAEILTKMSANSVHFSPHDRNQLIFGSTDHCVHLYDIRNVGKPVKSFRGHEKAVSYVRYIGTDEIVSASIDSSLRVWNISEGRCTKVLKGHTNEKNFVGLSGSGDHVVCGSDNGRTFFYFKNLSDPLLSYIMGEENDHDGNSDDFISSICWKKNSDHVLVANHLGKVHLLQIN